MSDSLWSKIEHMDPLSRKNSKLEEGEQRHIPQISLTSERDLIERE